VGVDGGADVGVDMGVDPVDAALEGILGLSLIGTMALSSSNCVYSQRKQNQSSDFSILWQTFSPKFLDMQFLQNAFLQYSSPHMIRSPPFKHQRQ